MSDWLAQDKGSLDALRIDSTVVDSNIAPPLDSGLLTAKAIEQVARQTMDDEKAKVWINEGHF